MANKTISTSQTIESVIASGLLPGENITVNGGATLTCLQTPSIIIGKITINVGILHVDGLNILIGNNINLIGEGGDAAIDETITVGGQGMLLVTGDWYTLGITNGTDNQILDVSTYWDNFCISSIPMIQIETGRRINYVNGIGISPAVGDMVTLIADRTVMGKIVTVGAGYVIVDLLTVPFVGGELIQIRKVVDNFGPDLQQTWTATVNGADVKEPGIYREFGNSRSNDIAYITGFGNGYGGLVFDNQHGSSTLMLGGVTGGFKPPAGCTIRVPNVNLNSSRIAEHAAGNAYRNGASTDEFLLYGIECSAGGTIDLSVMNAGNAYLVDTGAFSYNASYVGSVFGVGSNSAGSRTSYDHCVNVQDPVGKAEPNLKVLGGTVDLVNGADVTNCMQINSQVLGMAIGSFTSIDVAISNCIVSSAGQGLALDTNAVHNFYFSSVQQGSIINCMAFGNDHAEQDNMLGIFRGSDVTVANFTVSSTQDYTFQTRERDAIVMSGVKTASLVGVEVVGNGVTGNHMVNLTDASSIKVRAIGMIDDKIDFGTDGEYLVYISGLCNDIDIARCWKDNGVTEEAVVVPITAKNVVVTNCSGKYLSELQPSGGDNVRFKGVHGGAGTPGGATGWEDVYLASYGNSFHHGFQSDTSGTIACLMITPSTTTNETTVVSGNPKFFKDGDLDVVNGDVIIFEQGYFAKGITGFTGNFTTYIGQSAWFADEWRAGRVLDFQWMLEGGSWNGVWLDLRTPTNWTAIGGNIAAGVKLKIRLTATAAKSNMSGILIDTTTTLQAQKDNLYPIDQFSYNLSLTGLQPNTEVRVFRTSDKVELAGIENSSTIFSTTLNYIGDVFIVIHSVINTYIVLDLTLDGADVTIPIQQQIDPAYRNPIVDWGVPKLQDPDKLNQGTEIVYDTTARTIELLVAGNLTIEGVTIQCIHSHAKEEWKGDSTLIVHPYPFRAIDGPTGTQFELHYGWTWKNVTTTNLVKDGGWAIKDAAGVSLEEWMNITSLGPFNLPTDQARYLQSISGSVVNTTVTGEVDQAIKIYGDINHGNIDYRNHFEIFLTTYGASRELYDLMSEQKINSLTYRKYALPLSNTADPYITLDAVGASNLTGILIDGPNNTVTVSGPRTISEIYDYTQWWHSQEVNRAYPDSLMTADGTNYSMAVGWSLILNNAIVGGVNMTGDLIMGGLFDIDNHNVLGTLIVTIAGTYGITNSSIGSIANNSVGNVVANINSTTIGFNQGPNITINNTVSISVKVLDKETSLPVVNAGVVITNVVNGSVVVQGVTGLDGIMLVPSYNLLSTINISGIVRQGSSSIVYKVGRFGGTIGSNGLSVIIELNRD